jgi:hypothetical protein
MGGTRKTATVTIRAHAFPACAFFLPSNNKGSLFSASSPSCVLPFPPPLSCYYSPPRNSKNASDTRPIPLEKREGKFRERCQNKPFFQFSVFYDAARGISVTYCVKSRYIKKEKPFCQLVDKRENLQNGGAFERF